MKKTIICILVIFLVIAAAIYYTCMQREKFEKEKNEAVAEAVQNAIDSINQRQALQVPVQQSKAHKPPPPPPPAPKKKARTQVEPEPVEPDMLVDERDGHQYKIFETNGLWWMAQNLNFETQDSWCYELENSNCDNWGRLYTWDAAIGACPQGWHLPNDQEWSDLVNYYGGVHYAGKELKEGGASKFNALMSGYRDKAGFFGKGNISTYFWSSTEQNKDYASFKGIYSQVDNVGTYTYTKPDAISVRCVKNQ